MAYKKSSQRRLAAKQAVADLPHQTLTIESIDIEGNGIAHHDGKVVFVSGGITGERVRAQITRTKPSYDKAQVIHVIKASSQRVVPSCAHFGVCGGCSLQHVEIGTQVAIKQRALEESLARIGKLNAQTILSPIAGLSWGYRYRARFSVKDVVKKNTVLVGFHERASTYVADIKSCAVLPPHVSNLMMPLRELIGKLSVRAQVPQIEVAVGEVDTILLMRHLEPLTPSDIVHMDAFANRYSGCHAAIIAQASDTHVTQHPASSANFAKPHDLIWYTQASGPSSIAPLHEHRTGNLHYALPAFNITMPFKVSDFTQVNHPMNRVLVSKALALLSPQLGENVLDLFCGLGNFTLPLARVVGEKGSVMGIEGSETLTARAQANAIHNGLGNTSFEALNLFDATTETMYEWGPFDRWLIDPPREGAQAVCEAILNLPFSHRPKRIVYVSCNPATLARDAAILCRTNQWQLSKAGIANMFPHTSHVESIAVFERL
jgi:23S rRNA (uracil1939-C5)-methyltransferase